MKEANPYENISTDELPDILTALHIAGHLHTSRNHVYELFRLSEKVGGIKTFNVSFGKKRLVRVRKLDYLKWIG